MHITESWEYSYIHHVFCFSLKWASRLFSQTNKPISHLVERWTDRQTGSRRNNKNVEIQDIHSNKNFTWYPVLPRGKRLFRNQDGFSHFLFEKWMASMWNLLPWKKNKIQDLEPYSCATIVLYLCFQRSNLQFSQESYKYLNREGTNLRGITWVRHEETWYQY